VRLFCRQAVEFERLTYSLEQRDQPAQQDAFGARVGALVVDVEREDGVGCRESFGRSGCTLGRIAAGREAQLLGEPRQLANGEFRQDGCLRVDVEVHRARHVSGFGCDSANGEALCSIARIDAAGGIKNFDALVGVRRFTPVFAPTICRQV